MSRKAIIGVMGAGDDARKEDITMAFELGKAIALKEWTLLSGGRNVGVMHAVNSGAKEANGLTVGILPEKHLEKISDAVDVPIITDMGSARNNINILSSNVVIACGVGGAGTASEIALALKAKKPVILLNGSKEGNVYFKTIGKDNVHIVSSVEETVLLTETLL